MSDVPSFHPLDPRSRKDFPVAMEATPIYMNGRGISDKTRELNDAVWDAFDNAFIGAVIGIFAITLSVFGAFAAGHIGRSPPLVLLFGVIGFAGAVVWYKMHQPWRNAMDATIAHREAMEAETKKRGKGWAQS